MQNLIGISVADSAQQSRISQRPLECMVFNCQHLAKGIEIGSENINPSGVKRTQVLLTLDHMQGRTLFRTGLGQD